tara:strand:+ start:1517 stop:1978 length:462 start_codon:yes stop_codon:yes gene_type:complete
MKVRNHIEMITKSIEYVRIGNGLTFNEAEQTFVLSALQSLVSVDENKSVTRESIGSNVSRTWAFYPFHRKGICRLNTLSLKLKVETKRQIRENKIPLIVDIFDTIEHQMDLDATVRKMVDTTISNSNILYEKSCAINALKACIASPMEAIRDD